MKPRVHEVASELGLRSPRAVELLQAMGVHVKGPSSSISKDEADALRLAAGALSGKPQSRPVFIAKHPRTGALLHFTVNEAKHQQWLEHQERMRIVDASRAEAAARSREIYEDQRQARRDADRLRWEGSFEGPTEPRQADRAIIYRGGAPGLGKRA